MTEAIKRGKEKVGESVSTAASIPVINKMYPQNVSMLLRTGVSCGALGKCQS